MDLINTKQRRIAYRFGPVSRSVALRLRRAIMCSMAFLILQAGPSATAQTRAWKVARTIGSLWLSKKNRKTQGRHITDLVMNSMLCWFAVIKPGFQINTELVSNSASIFEGRNGAGLLIVTVHTRFGLAMNAALNSQGIYPVFVGAVSNVDPRKNSWGSQRIVESIDSQTPGLFFRIDAELRAGRVVILFVDFHTVTNEQRLLISPNAFKWNENAGHQMAYGLALAASNGVIEVDFEPASQTATMTGFASFLEKRMKVPVETCRPKMFESSSSFS